MNRTLVYPIPVRMSPERLQEITDALAKAAQPIRIESDPRSGRLNPLFKKSGSGKGIV